MVKMYTVSVDEAERLLLEETARHPTAPNRLTTRARILLVADQGEHGPGWSDTTIAEAFAVSVPTIERLRKRVVTEGTEAALQERRHRVTPGKVDGAQEARLTALACGEPRKAASAGRCTCWPRPLASRTVVSRSRTRRFGGF